MGRLLIFTLFIALLAWLLDSSFLPRRPPVVNYDLTEFFDPKKLHLPSSEADIIQLVEGAVRDGKQVRVLGSGHSRNSLAYSDDIIISLHNYKGIINLDKRTKQVTVRAGTTIEELADWLDERDLALPVLPAIMEQTLAGAISTATHGCRPDYGNLATLVTKLKLVTGTGEIVTLSAEDDDASIFKAAQVSLGLLGVLTEVTVQVDEAFRLEEMKETSTLPSCLQQLDQIAESAEHVKLWSELYSELCDIYRYNRTEKDVRMSDQVWKIGMKMHLWEPFLWLASLFPSFAPAIIENSMTYGKIFHPAYTQVGKSYQLLAYPLYVPNKNSQIEIAVSREDCEAAVRIILREIKKWKPASVFTEIRFVNEDDIWLSLNYGRRSCHLTAIIYDPSQHLKEGYFDSLYQSMLNAGMAPRVHLGKYISNSSLERDYPRYHDFREVRDKLDPHRIFVNEMLANHF